MTDSFWSNRRVFLTGHTGFKGGWMALWLSKLGAEVYGYSLPPLQLQKNFYQAVGLDNIVESSEFNDIRDFSRLTSAIQKAQPSIVIHMAAQPLVRESYKTPLETLSTNIMGTANLLEASLKVNGVEAFINVTSDKCYENKGWLWPYRENDQLGGADPYSASKACSEILTTAYRDSFFKNNNIGIASVRAGNVIGGGDWSPDRLVPDFIAAIEQEKILKIRSPDSTRPWQHVLEPVSGYILLAKNLTLNKNEFSGAWNFGPSISDCKTVSWIANYLCKKIPYAAWELEKNVQPAEQKTLTIDCSKSKLLLKWRQRWDVETALQKTLEWHDAMNNGEDMKDISLKQIEKYLGK